MPIVVQNSLSVLSVLKHWSLAGSPVSRLKLRYMKREGKIWIRVFPDKPYTKKPAEVRMGKGKGNPEGFVAPITPGRMIIEAEGVPLEIAKEALRLGAQKLPVTTKFVVRRDYVEQ